FASPSHILLIIRLFLLHRFSSRSALFPYTTLFRSFFALAAVLSTSVHADEKQSALVQQSFRDKPFSQADPKAVAAWQNAGVEIRSEEHTSELQSPDHLVCRLLLEKTNKRRVIDRTD